jgi:hypothetical protein
MGVSNSHDLDDFLLDSRRKRTDSEGSTGTTLAFCGFGRISFGDIPLKF